MLTPAKRLKEKLATNETVVGVMATDHVWPQLVEVCQRGGLDYLVVDREHGPHSDELIAQVCQVARLAEFPVLMRTVSCETSELRRAAETPPPASTYRKLAAMWKRSPALVSRCRRGIFRLEQGRPVKRRISILVRCRIIGIEARQLTGINK